MNYLVYPYKKMEITQNYNGISSHKKHTQGNYKDYPFDDRARDYFLCPCDEMKVARIYGVNGSGANTVWLESTSDVITPSGKSRVTIMIEHSNDNDLERLSVGQIFKRGNPICRGGVDGNVTGEHNHISVSLSEFKDCKNKGWVKNTKNKWVLTGKTVKPEKAFYLDDTTIVKNANLKFINKPKDTYQVMTVKTSSFLNVRNKPSLLGKKIGKLYNNEKVTIYNKKGSWVKISNTSEKWVSKNYLI